jgi:phosphate transport system substrate-binding protein
MKTPPAPRLLPFLAAAILAAPLSAAETITLAGHDEALVAVMRAWTADFAKRHPDTARLVVTELPAPKAGQGALDDPTAPPLAPNLLRFGPTAWTISGRERTEFAAKNGRPPLELTIGFGAAASKGKPHAIGLYVHPENPLRRLTFAQADAAFSADRRRGHREIKTWGDLGLTGEWASQPVHVTGRRLNNTVAASLREVLLLGGDFRPDYKEAADSVAAVAAVAGDRLALGFFGVGFATNEVRALAVAEKPDGPFVEPSEASVASGAYPLRRDFRLLLDWPAPPATVRPAVRQLVQYFFSAEAQAILAAEGLLPLPPAVLAAERARIR